MRAVADSAGAQVTLLGVQQSSGERNLFYSISDSRARRLEELPDAAADEAVLTRRPVRVTPTFDGEETVQVARALPGARPWIAVYSRSLEDVTETVDLIRRQVLVAGAVALLVALIGGWLVAARLARRVQRLEVAAERVAAGRFAAPIPVDADDELGQLTRTFNEMQGKLERVDRARREFIANASHELRTPIFSLGGFVELLRDEELDEQTREEFLVAIAEQVERLQKLATDLLDLSRLDAGSLDLVSEQVDLAEVAASVAREFTPALEAHDSTLSLELATGRVEAVCDPDRVAQIMRILLDNALRHTPPGTDVQISTDRDNGFARVTVTDTGPGLEENTREHAFERFFTADGARGSGLGLAIAQGACRAHERRRRAGGAPGPHDLQARTPGERGVRAALAGAACALALVVGGCSLGDEDEDRDQPATTTPEGPAAVETTRVQVVKGIGAKGGFDAAGIYDRLGPGVVTVISLFGDGDVPLGQQNGGLGSGFVLDADGYIATNTHVVTNGPRLARAREVFVDFADGNRVPARDRRDGPERGRCAAQGGPARPVAHPARARPRRGAPRGRARGGDREPVRRGAVALGRRHLRARPQHRVADRLRDRRRDPDRCRDQPRQLGRSAAERARPRDRHQRADQDRDGRGGRRGLRNSRGHRAAVTRRAPQGRARSNTATSVYRPSRSTPSSPGGSAST